MTEYIRLVGAEAVQSAANRMVEAAHTMSSAASNLDSVLERHQRWMDDWLQRFADLLEHKS